ncbi:MAG: biotin/lipoyl-binding protein, partial [Candidatus Acidiferrales bacterium]
MKRAEWMIGAALILALPSAGCGGSSAPDNTAAAAKSAPAPAAPATSTVDSQDILTVLSVEHEVDVLAQRDGPVVTIIKDEGSRVRKGDVLARLDQQSLESEAQKIEADLR